MLGKKWVFYINGSNHIVSLKRFVNINFMGEFNRSLAVKE